MSHKELATQKALTNYAFKVSMFHVEVITKEHIFEIRAQFDKVRSTLSNDVPAALRYW